MRIFGLKMLISVTMNYINNFHAAELVSYVTENFSSKVEVY